MTTPPADQYFLYVLALSKQVTLTQLVNTLAERLGPLQMVELVTVPQVQTTPPADPWWWALAPGERVVVTADAQIYLATGEPATVGAARTPIVRKAGALLDITRTPTAQDRAARWAMVYPDLSPFPGGLFVQTDKIKKDLRAGQ